MIDIVEGAGVFAGEEGLAVGDHLLDLSWGRGFADGGR
jgi:hypothetical protein